ncbi:MAG: hypothetical protein ACOCZE_11630 [Planctomycetota bacterium]
MSMQSRLGSTYTHAMGLSFSHPADWSVQSTADGLILTPGTGGQTTGGLTESYLVMTEAAPGLRNPAGRRVVEIVDELVASQSAGLDRSEGPDEVPCRRGRGARLVYSGQTRTGQRVTALAYVSLQEELSALLVGMGPAEAVDARRDVLDDVFASFQQVPAQQDLDLVGTWYRAHRAGGGYVSAAGYCLELRADGTFEQFEMTGPAVGGPASEEEEPSGRAQGFWRTRGDELEMVRPDGRREQFTFSIQGATRMRKLKLLHIDGSQQTWTNRLC